VYGRWLTRELSIAGPIRLARQNATGKYEVRSRNEFDDAVKAVCAACNHGWSHDLERAFRALMAPALRATGDVVLSKDSQQVVAAWATKLWLLAELSFASMRNQRVSAPGVFRSLRASGAPPPTTRVWIGGVQQLPDAEGNNVLTWLSTHVVQSSRGQEVGVLGILTVGNLLLAVFGPFGPDAGRKVASISAKTTALLQVWPNKIGEVRWPPSAVLTTDQLAVMFPAGRVITVPDAP
jgi:hypothetical protein